MAEQAGMLMGNSGVSTVKQIHYYESTNGGSPLPAYTSEALDSYNPDTNQNEPVKYLAFSGAWAYDINPIVSYIDIQWSDDGVTWTRYTNAAGQYPTFPTLSGILAGHRYYRVLFSGVIRVRGCDMYCIGPVQ